MRPLRLAVSAALVATIAVTAGCSGTVSLPPGAEANDPRCAEVSVRLPDTVAGLDRRWTDAQATGAWGRPAAVLLTCGVTPPGPTEQRCITIGDVDWIVDESQAPRYLVTTYGRTPAVEVFVDNEAVSPNEVLEALSSAVSAVPADAACTASDTIAG